MAGTVAVCRACGVVPSGVPESQSLQTSREGFGAKHSAGRQVQARQARKGGGGRGDTGIKERDSQVYGWQILLSNKKIGFIMWYAVSQSTH